MYPHRIRLRGPWECAETGSADAPRRVTVPCRLRDAGLPGFSGQVCLSRKFGYPGRIDAFERVWLTFAGIRGRASISLNDVMLATATGPWEFDVTSLLRPHNRLTVSLLAESDEAGLVGEVALEVRCAVYLRNLRVDRPGTELVVTGELAGSWPEPFDLYVFFDNVQVDYQSLQTSGDTTPFRAVLPADTGQFAVRVDLIQGPSLWSSVEA